MKIPFIFFREKICTKCIDSWKNFHLINFYSIEFDYYSIKYYDFYTVQWLGDLKKNNNNKNTLIQYSFPFDTFKLYLNNK